MDEERIGQIPLQRFKGKEKQNWNPTQREQNLNVTSKSSSLLPLLMKAVGGAIESFLN